MAEDRILFRGILENTTQCSGTSILSAYSHSCTSPLSLKFILSTVKQSKPPTVLPALSSFFRRLFFFFTEHFTLAWSGTGTASPTAPNVTLKPQHTRTVASARIPRSQPPRCNQPPPPRRRFPPVSSAFGPATATLKFPHTKPPTTFRFLRLLFSSSPLQPFYKHCFFVSYSKE